MNDAHDEARLLELAALPADDPRRREAERDPRVRAWLLEHAAFVAGEPLDADTTARVDRAAGEALARARADVAREPARVIALPRAAVTRRGLPRWALAAAALAVVAGALVVLPRPGARREPAYRSPGGGAASAAIATQPATRSADGGWVFRWTRHPGAETHRVEILQGLTAVATFDAGTADSLVLAADALPAGEALAWRVLALRDGETLATSAPRTLER